jgi:predicted AAA+ superfamily ATPase
MDHSLDRIARCLEQLVPADLANRDWTAVAYQWRRRQVLGTTVSVLHPVRHPALIDPDSLLGVDTQKTAVLRNTEQFVRGLPANNVLLTGARGTGKSSLVRAALSRHAADGLRVIEVDKSDLIDLPAITDLVAERPERFIVFCDDLSFEPGESSYKALKAALDGSIAAASGNLLIYATSNRRHLMPESMQENLAAHYDDDGDLHPGETAEEKISLSERFGLWVSFQSFRQDDYLRIVNACLAKWGLDAAAIHAARPAALQFALQRGSRSGRVANQFARDHAGTLGLSA